MGLCCVSGRSPCQRKPVVRRSLDCGAQGRVRSVQGSASFRPQDSRWDAPREIGARRYLSEGQKPVSLGLVLGSPSELASRGR